MAERTNQFDGGEAIVAAFRRLGTDHIMSSPGSEWGPVWEALARQKLSNTPGPTFIEAWHENLAVNMAQGYTLMTGQPQAVMLHAGVGLLHGAMGILTALQAEVPMLVMSGESVSLGEDPNLPIEPQWYGGLSVGGPERLVGPLVKHARQVSSPYTLQESVVRAMELAARQPQGPVYLNVPLEHMLQGWTPSADARPVPPAPKVRPPDEDVADVADLLRRAKNPVIVTEGSGRDPAAFAALVALADLWAIPVIGGNNVAFANFPTDHALWQGYGDYAMLPEADLVLLVGGRAPWYPPHRRPTPGTIVAIHDNPIKAHMVYQNLHVDRYLEGDIASALHLLSAAARPGTGDASAIAARRARAGRGHEAYETRRRAAEHEARAGDGIDPVALTAALAAALPKDAIVVDESITAHPIVRQHLNFTQPRSYFRVFGGLGQGLGMALGVKLAAKQRPVVAVSGDGGFLYNPVIQALGASKTHGLPILAVIYNNGRYQAMKQGHVHHYPAGISVGADLFYGVHIAGPNYEEFAQPFGFWGRKIDRLDALPGALAEALAAMKDGKSAILNVTLTR